MRAPKLTRRSFFKTAAAGSAVAAAVGLLAGCTHPSSESDDVSEPVVVEEDTAVDAISTYDQVDLSLEVANSWTLPLGNVLHPAEGSWIPVTSAGSSATPMVKASALSLESGQLTEVVSEPLGQATTTVIYDARCSDSTYAWIELNLSTRDWVLYASRFSEGQLSGEVKTLWEGDANFDPAPFAVSGTSVVWQVQPSLSGDRTSEHSFCYLWHVGDADAQAVVESPGRFSTSPSISGDAVVLTPRVRDSEGVYYAVTAYSLSDDMSTKLDQLVMPRRVAPFRATRVGERFYVSVEASYGSGGLLGNMGTYIGTSNGDFVRFNAEPSECGCGKGDTFVIKRGASYALINVAEKTYATILASDRTVDYGEFPARTGECDLFVTFATVKDSETGHPASVAVRTFHL